MLNTTLTKILVLAATAATFVGCTAGIPKSTKISSGKNSGIKLSTKSNLAMAGGTAVSGGTYKVKFTMGYNQGASDPSQVSVFSGTNNIRPSSAGVIREE